jgi:hypothetical protein
MFLPITSCNAASSRKIGGAMEQAQHSTRVSHSTDHASHGDHARQMHHYPRLGLMALLSFIAMYVLMYAMVDVFDNVLPNVNQVYMAGLMAAPMVLIELALMGMMYPNKRANLAIAAVSVVLGLACWFGIRTQAGIGNEQFLKSMVPHHAGAVLMCERASLTDPQIQRLCGQIIRSQRAEIAQMKALLRKTDG